MDGGVWANVNWGVNKTANRIAVKKVLKRLVGIGAISRRAFMLSLYVVQTDTSNIALCITGKIILIRAGHRTQIYPICRRSLPRAVEAFRQDD